METRVINGIKVIRCSNPDKVVADIFAKQIRSNPSSTLGLATGSTPLATYQNLIDMKLDWSCIKTYNLDEYCGIKQSNPQSYYSFMHDNLFNKVNISESNVHFLNSEATNISQEVSNYESAVQNAKIDIQLLGIGSNGHIAFNEPGSSRFSKTRQVSLTENTIKDNSRFFKKDEFQPTKALSMGIDTIMSAKKIVLIAKGKEKENAIKSALGTVSSSCPASFLQEHNDVTFVISDDINLD